MRPNAADDQADVHQTAGTHQTLQPRNDFDAISGSAENCREPKDSSEMDDDRRGIRPRALSVNAGGSHSRNETHDDELQADEGACGRPDDYVEVLTSVECCHTTPADRPIFAKRSNRWGQFPHRSTPDSGVWPCAWLRTRPKAPRNCYSRPECPFLSRC